MGTFQKENDLLKDKKYFAIVIERNIYIELHFV